MNFRHPPPGALVVLGRALRENVDAAVDVGVAGLIDVVHGVEHRARLLGAGGVVEVGDPLAADLLGQDREVAADLFEVVGGGGDHAAKLRLSRTRWSPAAASARTATTGTFSTTSAGETPNQDLVRIHPPEPPGTQVEERVLVQLADGGAVGALDVVGVDLEAGPGVDRRLLRQQQVAVRLAGVGPDGARRHHHLAVENGARLVGEHVLEQLAARGVPGRVDGEGVLVGLRRIHAEEETLEVHFGALRGEDRGRIRAGFPPGERQDRRVDPRVPGELEGDPAGVRDLPALELDPHVAEFGVLAHAAEGARVRPAGRFRRAVVRLDHRQPAARRELDHRTAGGSSPGGRCPAAPNGAGRGPRPAPPPPARGSRSRRARRSGPRGDGGAGRRDPPRRRSPPPGGRRSPSRPARQRTGPGAGPRSGRRSRRGLRPRSARSRPTAAPGARTPRPNPAVRGARAARRGPGTAGSPSGPARPGRRTASPRRARSGSRRPGRTRGPPRAAGGRSGRPPGPGSRRGSAPRRSPEPLRPSRQAGTAAAFP